MTGGNHQKSNIEFLGDLKNFQELQTYWVFYSFVK